MSNGIAYLYARVSTQIQVNDGISLDAQVRQMEYAALAADYEPVILREEGRSGKSIQGRPVLRNALDDLDTGKASAPPHQPYRQLVFMVTQLEISALTADIPL
jgi:DNA invertase Pin-like site-specific DNA recombinase